MRILALIPAIVFSATLAPAPVEMTPLERQRLVAHLEMTSRWLTDEVSNLSPAQLGFRRAPGAWSILEVLDHLLVVAPIYWDDLQKAVKGKPSGRDLSAGDPNFLWYGVDRTNREPALASEMPKGELRDLKTFLDSYRKYHARLLQYVKTSTDDLRNRMVERQGSDAYQWALLISTHEQRHILQIREIKADQKFPAR